MKYCFDCIHYPVCENCTKICAEFKDSEKFVEIPFSLGDTVYVINLGDYTTDYKPFIMEKEICSITKTLMYDGTESEWHVTLNGYCYSFSSFGSTWFIDRFAAEERLEKILYGN